MPSTLVRKSFTDLTRRKARALFTVLTLALAVASVGILAVSPLMERSMEREVAANRLPDVTVSMAPLSLDRAELARLAELPNVMAVEARSVFATRVFLGDRRDKAMLIGVADFARQRADVVTVDSGTAPGVGAVLTDRNNGRANSFSERTGAVARVIASDGAVRSLEISGVARNLTGADRVNGGFVTLYASTQTVAELSGTPGYSSLGFRLRDNSPAAAESLVAQVRNELRASTAFTAFADLPVIPDPGSYPGKDEFEQLASVLNVLTLLALLSALVLLSVTMSTLVAEQTGEIAAMKAIGARRRDIRRLYLRTALLFGALGSVVGTVLGIALANAVVRFFARLFFGVEAAFGISVPVLAVSLLVGLLGPPLAAYPAVGRAARLPLNETLQAAGTPLGSPGVLDALLRRVAFLPRTTAIGLRNLARRKRRSFATALQVSIAVAILLALLSVGAGVGQTTKGWFDDNRFDIWIASVANKPLSAEAGRSIAGTDGVAESQAWLRNDVSVGGEYAQAWGVPTRPMINTHLTAGRWYTDAEARERAQVAVLAPTIAKTTGKRVGDLLELRTGNGPLTLRVIGLSGNTASRSATAGHNGSVVFLPLTTLQSALRVPAAVNSYWISTASDDHALIDRTTTRVEDALAAHGDQVGALVNYDMKAKQVAGNTSITTAVTVLGMLIVAISMVGLVNAMTMTVLERTREIGMLRCIGARARDVRRIFATEGLAVALLGWLLGVPLGYLLAGVIGRAAGNAVGAELAFTFPLSHILIALVGTVVLALVVLLAPLRRAVRFKPGEALRYA